MMYLFAAISRYYMSSFRVLGAIWSRTFVVSGLLSDKIVFSFIAIALLGPTANIIDSLLVLDTA